MPLEEQCADLSSGEDGSGCEHLATASTLVDNGTSGESVEPLIGPAEIVSTDAAASKRDGNCCGEEQNNNVMGVVQTCVGGELVCPDRDFGMFLGTMTKHLFELLDSCFGSKF